MASLFQPPIFAWQTRSPQIFYSAISGVPQQQPLFIPVLPSVTAAVITTPPSVLMLPPPPVPIFVSAPPLPPLVLFTYTAAAAAASLAVPVTVSPLPPGSPSTTTRATIALRVIFYRRRDDGQICCAVTDAAYGTAPSKDRLLADLGHWSTAHHGIDLVAHGCGGAVKPAQVRLLVLPAGEVNCGRSGAVDGPAATLGLAVLPESGPVMPGNAVWVVRLDRDEQDEEALRQSGGKVEYMMEEVRRRGYTAFVLVDVDAPAEAVA